jgi:23S rRNA G2445 N2-methylase RlmL
MLLQSFSCHSLKVNNLFSFRKFNTAVKLFKHNTIVCGDSTDMKIYQELFHELSPNKELADALITDPPYCK